MLCNSLVERKRIQSRSIPKLLEWEERELVALMPFSKAFLRAKVVHVGTAVVLVQAMRVSRRMC